MTTTQSQQQQSLDPFLADPAEPRASFIDLLTWVGAGKARIATTTFFCSMVAAAYMFMQPDVYTAYTTLLPPQQQSNNASAALSALGSLGATPGLPAIKTPEDLYVGVLKSNAVTRPLIDKFELKSRYKVSTYEGMRAVLSKYVTISADKKSGLILVEVDDTDPEFAAKLANEHVAQLIKVMSHLAVSEAQQRRMFFTKQLQDTNAALLAAEQALLTVQRQSGVVALDKQAEAMIMNAAKLRALIVQREVELRVLRTGATDRNPEAVRLVSEIQAMRGELARIESARKQNADGPMDISVSSLPEAASSYTRAVREVKYQEVMLQSMLRQLEMAKLDEAKEGYAIQQVDAAVAPDRKSKPARAAIVLLTAISAAFLSTFYVILAGYLEKARTFASEDHQRAWQTMVSAWRLRGRA
jgi:tyrosine-protein kinase Etk/Wzc